ncbi:hypothetical protein [Bacillus badius]|uniref:Uncharacterized protein n=1 Tax=Bacillus badius TaxID=1455 RepID=A0ABR5AZK9_BACBA|nr:hypothetical protein [Bacillus badius]KIL80156.1 hypothetical protein SD77_0004 [Bacillus badius]MED4718401.1 hypothetical protein [Bacillus badius]
MENVLRYYEDVDGKFPIVAYLVDFSLGLDPAEYEVEWLYNKGYSTIPHAIRRCKRVSPTEKLVLEEIYMSMGFRLESTMAQKTIASLLDIGVDTVRENIKKLEDKKFLDVNEYQGRYYYCIKSLSLNPYIIMSELTHYAKKAFETKTPKAICEGGVHFRIEKLVKSQDYKDYIGNLTQNPSYPNILLIQKEYFRQIEVIVKSQNGIDISIPII